MSDSDEAMTPETEALLKRLRVIIMRTGVDSPQTEAFVQQHRDKQRFVKEAELTKARKRPTLPLKVRHKKEGRVRRKP